MIVVALGFDPGKDGGLAFASFDTRDLVVHEVRTHSIHFKSYHPSEVMPKARAALLKLLHTTDPKSVVTSIIEDTHFGKNVDSLKKVTVSQTMWRCLVWEVCGIDSLLKLPTTWRSPFKIHPSKGDVKKQAQAEVKRRFGVTASQDASEALLMAVYGAESFSIDNAL